MNRKTISLSSHLGVKRKDLEDFGIFDATLGIDTKLFIDPKLLVNSNITEFKNSRKEIIQYFNKLLRVHVQSAKSQRLMNEAINMLAVPEPKGLSIGYGDKSDKGTSVPKNVAKKILLSASEILAVGIEDAEIIELLGLFVDGFGPDSLSDLVVKIIYHDFCLFTENISKKIGVKVEEYTIDNKKYRLPRHPYSNNHIIFIPNAYLRMLPVANSWDEISAAASHNDKLRKEMNDIVIPSINKNIESLLNKNATDLDQAKKDLLKLIDVYRAIEAKSYDLSVDNAGYYAIQPFVDNENGNIKCSNKPSDFSSLVIAIRELIVQYKRAIEDNGGNKLLFRKSETGALLKDKPHHEDVAQIIFYLIADLFCSKANILLARESDAGLGPVDFSLGTGYDSKILVEIKKSNNKSLLDGYQKQLRAYEKSENSKYSFYVVIIVKKPDPKSKTVAQLNQVRRIYEENKKNNINTPELVIIDGIINPSPSKLK